MATTESRSGFRLPWNASSDAVTTPADASDASTDATALDAPQPDSEVSVMSDPSVGVVDAEAATPASGHAADVPGAPHGAGRKPNKFLADLTKAMQAAAEAARETTLSQLQGDAKSFVEGIHGRSATEAADLRKHADDDIAEIREWSKTEIARIREETEERISGRKSRLETEIEQHAGRIEREIERVQARVAEFETEMDGFFERLRGEDDPTRFAAMAENLPEPPSFDEIVRAVAAEPAPVPAAPAGSEVPAATYEAAPVADATADTERPVEGTADEIDPRLAAFGLSADFAAAAEAEAAAALDGTPEGEEVDVLDEDDLQARLAGLMPAGPGEASTEPAATPHSTQVVVVGLVSVASIASFKRHLGRLPGVHSVGVSSGPDGEFVFTVTHGDDIALRDAVPTIPGFGARVTAADDQTVRVAARDPESEA